MAYLSGTYAYSVDDRGRLAVPAKLRDKLGDVVWVTIWQGKLRLYPEAAWEIQVKHVLDMSGWENNGSDMRLAVFSEAYDCQIDGQGRILIPANLREAVGITENVVIVGAGDHVQIWDRAQWNVKRQDLDQQPSLRSTTGTPK